MNLTHLLRDGARRGREGTRAAGRRAWGPCRVADVGVSQTAASAMGGKGGGDGGGVEGGLGVCVCGWHACGIACLGRVWGCSYGCVLDCECVSVRGLTYAYQGHGVCMFV